MADVRAILRAQQAVPGPGRFVPRWSIEMPAATGLLAVQEGRELIGEAFERLWADADVDHLVIRFDETKAYERFVAKGLLPTFDRLGEEVHVFRHGSFLIEGNVPPKLGRAGGAVNG